PRPTQVPAHPKPSMVGFSADSAQSLHFERGTRMDVLIGVIITFLVVILVLYLVNMLPIDGRAKQIVRVIVIIIGVISLLKYLAVFYLGALAPPILALHGRRSRSRFQRRFFAVGRDLARPISATARHEPVFTLI